MSAEEAPRALILLAEGAEEMEVVITVDVLRRARVDAFLAGVDGPDCVVCSRGVVLVPDGALVDAVGPWDVVVLPGGGEGTRRLALSSAVGELLAAHAGTVAAICAAPSALARHQIGRGAAMTCHPAVSDVVAAHARLVDAPLVEDGRFVTSRGPGTAFEFALALVRRLCGAAAADAVRGPMCFADGA